MRIFFVLVTVVGVLTIFQGVLGNRSKKQVRKHPRKPATGNLGAFLSGGVATSLLLDELLNTQMLNDEVAEQLSHMNLAEMEQFAMDQAWLDQAQIDALNQQMMDQMQMDQTQMDEVMRQMADPYVNPGMDIVVDETYHGIDHGLGIADPSHDMSMDSAAMDHSFGSGMDGF